MDDKNEKACQCGEDELPFQGSEEEAPVGEHEDLMHVAPQAELTARNPKDPRPCSRCRVVLPVIRTRLGDLCQNCHEIFYSDVARRERRTAQRRLSRAVRLYGEPTLCVGCGKSKGTGVRNKHWYCDKCLQVGVWSTDSLHRAVTSPSGLHLPPSGTMCEICAQHNTRPRPAVAFHFGKALCVVCLRVAKQTKKRRLA